MLNGDKYERPIGVLFDAGERRRIAGQLKLKKSDLFDCNVLSIADDQFLHIRSGDSLHGISKAGKVSLLDCVRGGLLGSTNWGDFAIHHGNVSFRYALFGKRHMAIDEKCIRGIQFTLEGAQSSVFMHDKFERFGQLHDPDEEILDAIERKRPDYLTGKFVKGKAMVSYFTGDWDFLPRFETVLGTVHVGRIMQGDFHGQNTEDTPRITIEFDDEPTTLENALWKMREVRQFFAWMMGYAPVWNDVLVFTSPLGEDGFRPGADAGLEVLFPNEWSEVPAAAAEYGTLIDASQHPDHFIEVMAKWLERDGNASRKSANARFFGSMPGRSDRVIEDGIVSAANTFDLLPSEDKPDAQPLPDEVLEIIENARNELKDVMTAGPLREDVLNALGRMRANRRLRDIVEHRAKIVMSRFAANGLQHLNDVIRLAVKCRNYYTHGPGDRDPRAVDYTDFELVHFLTQTLEFIYCASELLHCGWDPGKSARDEWHPITAYAKFYDATSSKVLGHVLRRSIAK